MVYSINLEDLYCGMALQGILANSNVSYALQQVRDALAAEDALTPEVIEGLNASMADLAAKMGSLLYKTRMKQKTNDQDDNLPCGPNCGVYVPSESGDTKENTGTQPSNSQDSDCETNKGCV